MRSFHGQQGPVRDLDDSIRTDVIEVIAFKPVPHGGVCEDGVARRELRKTPRRDPGAPLAASRSSIQGDGLLLVVRGPVVVDDLKLGPS
jgi:hypothetical protein